MASCTGGFRGAATPPLLKDSERGGMLGSDILLPILCGMAGELCRFNLERSSTVESCNVCFLSGNGGVSFAYF